MNVFEHAKKEEYDVDCGCLCCSGCGLWKTAEKEYNALLLQLSEKQKQYDIACNRIEAMETGRSVVNKQLEEAEAKLRARETGMKNEERRSMLLIEDAQKLRDELQQKDRLLGEAREHLQLLMPLAKGYAYNKPVGANLAIVADAEKFMEKRFCDYTESGGLIVCKKPLPCPDHYTDDEAGEMLRGVASRKDEHVHEWINRPTGGSGPMRWCRTCNVGG